MNLRTLLPAAIVAAAFAAAPVVASAAPTPQSNFGDHRADYDRRETGGRDRYDHRDNDRRDDHRYDRDHDRDRGGIDLDIRIGGGGYRPAFEERRVQVWVPAVYRTECDQVWVPEICEDREVRVREHGHWHTRVEQVVVTPGHYETRERQVLVSPGHYETRVERVRTVERDRPGFGFRFGG